MEILNKVPPKILVIQTAFIGDAVLTLPFLQLLKQQNSDCLIDVITIGKTKSIFEASPAVNEVFIFDKKGKHKSLLGMYKFGKQISQKKYVKLYSPHRSIRSSLLVLFTSIRESYGFNTSEFPYVYKHQIEYKKDMHEIERLFGFLEQNNLPDFRNSKFQINISSQAHENVKVFLHNFTDKKKLIAFAPGTEWETKRYPDEYYAKIVNELVLKDYICLLIGSEKESQLCESIRSKVTDNCYNLSGKFSIIETIELLKNVALLVTNDSAPTHFGMCAGIPTLTIYCSTVPGFGFYPFNEKSKFLSFDKLDCKPCGIHGYNECPLEHFKCGKNISPELVLNEIQTMIKNND